MGTYLAFSTYRVSYLAGTGAGAWPYHPPPYIVEVKERVDLYLYPAMARYKLRFIFFLVLPVMWDVRHMGVETSVYKIFGRGTLKKKTSWKT